MGKTTVTSTQKLVILQKKLLRAVVNVPNDAPTSSLYRQYNRVRVERMFDYRFAFISKQTVTRNDPFFFSNIVTFTQYQNPYSNRKTNTFVLPWCKTNYGHSMLPYIFPTYYSTPVFENISRILFTTLRNAFIE